MTMFWDFLWVSDLGERVAAGSGDEARGLSWSRLNDGRPSNLRQEASGCRVRDEV